jgi:hypothetical protein
LRFTLVVVTTDRLELVERLFRSLAAQTRAGDFEVIFVHSQVCAAEAKALAGKYAYGFPITCLTSQDHCLSRSRNSALPLISGDVVAFPDDDCVYRADTLARAAAAFEREPDAGVILGHVADLSDIAVVPDERPQHLAAPVELTHCRFLFRHSISFVQFHKKECVRAVGKFDENMGVGCATPYQSGEDTDYVLRARKAGFRVFHDASVAVGHPAVNLHGAALREKVESYARGRMRLLHKHGLPGWFVLANIAYPLLCIPAESWRRGVYAARYRWWVFSARLTAWIEGIAADKSK